MPHPSAVGLGRLGQFGQPVELPGPRLLEVGRERPERTAVRQVVATGSRPAHRDQPRPRAPSDVGTEGDLESVGQVAGTALSPLAHRRISRQWGSAMTLTVSTMGLSLRRH